MVDVPGRPDYMHRRPELRQRRRDKGAKEVVVFGKDRAEIDDKTVGLDSADDRNVLTA